MIQCSAGIPKFTVIDSDRRWRRLPRLAGFHRSELAGASAWDAARHAQSDSEVWRARHDGVGKLQDARSDLPAERARSAPWNQNLKLERLAGAPKISCAVASGQLRASEPHDEDRPSGHQHTCGARGQSTRRFLQQHHAGGRRHAVRSAEPAGLLRNRDEQDPVRLHSCRTSSTTRQDPGRLPSPRRSTMPRGLTEYGTRARSS